MIFIMVFMCRKFIIIWRSTWVGKYVIEFDDAVSNHKLCAKFFGVAMWVHVAAHVVNVESIVDPNNFDLWLTNEEANNNEGTTQDTRWDVYTSATGMTGLLLTFFFSIVFLFALEWPRTSGCFQGTAFGKFANDFNTFWVTHHIVFLCFILLLIHPWPGWCWDPCEASDGLHGDTWQWIIVPFLCYFCERLNRSIKSRTESKPRVLLAKVKPGNVLQLRMTKPAAWDVGQGRVKAGHYCFIKCSHISNYEWHPFTLTSAPDDPFMECHIRGLGDWTKELVSKFGEAEKAQALLDKHYADTKDAEDPKASAKLLEGMPRAVWPEMGLEGPFGAPAQEYENFEIVLLVGAGIGITPFASILKEICYKFNSLRCPHVIDGVPCPTVNTKLFPIKKVYFNFISRNQGEMTWCVCVRACVRYKVSRIVCEP